VIPVLGQSWSIPIDFRMVIPHSQLCKLVATAKLIYESFMVNAYFRVTLGSVRYRVVSVWVF